MSYKLLKQYSLDSMLIHIPIKLLLGIVVAEDDPFLVNVDLVFQSLQLNGKHIFSWIQVLFVACPRMFIR